MKTTLYTILLLSIFFTSCSDSNSKKTTDLKFKGGELRYTDSITETQAKALGNFLVETDFFDETPRTVQLDKVNGIIHFAIVVDDSVAHSPEFKTMGIAIIDELEQNVFKGNTVEVDYCDGYFKLIKNIKGGQVVALPPSHTDTINGELVTMIDENPADLDKANLILGYWICTNITGGEVENSAKRAKELAILRENFTFEFDETRSFGSQFINQSNLNEPVEVLGNFTIVKNKIFLQQLSINGEKTSKEMQYDFRLTDEQLQLISKIPGKQDLVMSFERTR